jgi:predicted membrane-bound spermidine synthase
MRRGTKDSRATIPDAFMSSPRGKTWLFLLIGLQALVSAASLVVEIVAGRVLAPYVGMSIYTWTSVIAVVLAGFSAGHWLGGRIAERPVPRALAFTGWTLIAAAVLSGIAVGLMRLLAGPVMTATSDPVWAIVLLTSAVFFLPSLMAGVPAPVLTHAAITTTRENPARALGAMFASGAVGAIGGTLLAGFLFIPWLGTTKTLIIVSLVYIAGGLGLFAMSGAHMRRCGQALPFVLGVVALGAYSAGRASPCHVESQYYCIRVADVSPAPDEPVNLMVLDHLSHGTSAKNHPRVMFTAFTAMLDEIARRRLGDRPFSAFFIGGGTYSVPRAWADRATGPVTVAEIDPEVTGTAQELFWFDPEGMEIIHQDARYALQMRADARYDVVVGDAFGDIAVPEHLVTREFFELVRSRLHDDGIFLMNVIDFVEKLDALAAIHLTLSEVFPSVEIWTEAVPPEPGQQRVFVLAAAREPSPFDAFTVRAPEPTRFAALADGFAREVLSARDPFVLTDDFSPIDRLLSGTPY